MIGEYLVDHPDGTVLSGTSDTVATYVAGDGVRIDGHVVATDLWDWLDGLHGTWVGYLGYGVGDREQRSVTSPAGVPDALWMRVDEVREAGPEAAFAAVNERSFTRGAGLPTSNPDQQAYLAAIGTIKEHLAAGESYEVCLTRTLSLAPHPDPFALFLAMREASPTGRNVYLRSGDVAIASATPEEFLSITPGGVVSSSPIKGTAPRHHDDRTADRAAADELTSDPKTRAENLMIVDLVRNDLNRVCEPGSVTVPRFLEVESYSTVHQLVSTVTGRLAPTRTRVDAIRAAFPPGSMTGAPKERTMQIIDALEQVPRGVYSGAIGILTADGGADLRVVIRTAVTTPDATTIGTGGAIVWASDPEQEWEETELKLKAVLSAYDRTRAALD
ncbi:anthranilate synthase component I family protein [Nocardioides sp. Kera G14]|uniref:anthranilate synthase component I family protein n=1 Tax=Nocardioides sp. Kera G14 TaxID=2884264 RepID=UPI001D114B10|nr:anthranilate synthase component I family protein [Nocardioides sp. Kera G14]UDY23939.1 anthranilate synthase component I family protein [Nocardioides sp. Kera G14]